MDSSGTAGGRVSRDGIEVVTFDVEGTLVGHSTEPWPPRWLLAAGGAVASREDLIRAEKVAAASLREPSLMWRSDAEARAGVASHYRAYLEALDACASGLVEALVAEYLNPARWRPYEDVAPALRDLRQIGVRLGVVADWVSELGDLLFAAGIRWSFDFVLASAAVGATKADGGLYRLAVNAAGVPSGRVLHVGDDFEVDFLAARRAGLRAVHLDRSGRSGIPDLGHVVALVGGG